MILYIFTLRQRNTPMKTTHINQLKEKAFCQASKSEYNAAIFTFTAILELCPKDAYILFNKALIEYEKALYDCNTALEKQQLLIQSLNNSVSVIRLYADNHIHTGILQTALLISRLIKELQLPQSLFNSLEFYRAVENRHYNLLLSHIQILEIEILKISCN